jgi:hypothetical protein
MLWQVTNNPTNFEKYYTAADIPITDKPSMVERITSGLGTGVTNIISSVTKPLYPLIIMLFIMLLLSLIILKKAGLS